MQMTGFWWILAACAAYGVLHSILASRRVKRMAARMFGQSTYDRYYRLFFSIMGTITALPLFVMAALLPDQAAMASQYSSGMSFARARQPSAPA